MIDDVEEPAVEEPAADDAGTTDEGPGWMPAILAATALMGIVGFIFCAFSTWLLFQKRTDFAIRTLESLVPQLEQSRMEPDTKTSIIAQTKDLLADMKRGKYENWQSAGIMQRLQRLPVMHWGDLGAVETFLVKSDDAADAADARKQLSRLRRAVEMGNATSFDFEDVLTPVYFTDESSPSGHRMITPLTLEAAHDVVSRARLLADRERVPDELFENVRIESIVKKEIEAAAIEGGF